jgi:L-malate glycosyltransferase
VVRAASRRRGNVRDLGVAQHSAVTSASEDARAVVRVCLVAPSLDILGGQAVQADRLLRRLRETPGLDVELLPVNPRLPGPLRVLQRIKYVRTMVTTIAYAAALLTRLRRCDVVHAFSASYFSYLLAPFPAMLLGRAFGRKVVLNYHSGEAGDHLARWPLSRHSMRLAHLVLVPSEYLVEVFATYGIRAEAIPNHVDVEEAPYRERTAPRPIFFCNRNMQPHYNVGCVIRAFALIQRELPEAELLLAGDGPQRPELERLAGELGVGRVTFLGQVAPGEMPALYARADVFLNASDIDNMPLSILEAQAAGLPVVTSDAGGIPFIVEQGRTGLLVPRGDCAALAEAALRLVRECDAGLAQARCARESVMARYAWSSVGARWRGVYHSLAGRRSVG